MTLRNNVFVLALIMTAAFQTMLSQTRSNQDPLPRRASIGFAAVPRPEAKPGVLVTAIVPDSTAEKARLQVNDVVIKINDIFLKDLAAYSKAVRAWRVGQTVKLSILRND